MIQRSTPSAPNAEYIQSEGTLEQGKCKDPLNCPPQFTGILILAGTIRRLREVPSPLLLVPSTLLNDKESKMAQYKIETVDGVPIYPRKKMALVRIPSEEGLF